MKSNSISPIATKLNPHWHGVMLVAGGAVGAGMFALPLVSAGAWFVFAVLGLVVVCVFTFLAATLLIDANVKYPVGSSFDTLIRDVLGDRWASVNNISIAFIMFILMYAYITAGANILNQSLGHLGGEGGLLPRPVLSLLFSVLVALFVWFGTSMVSRLSTVLLIAMCVAFVSASSGLVVNIDLSVLLNTASGDISYLWAALPVFVTAFACGGLVPSLCIHYENQRKTITLSVLLGLLLALFVYVVWLAATLANISRADFVGVSNNGGGLSALVDALQSRTDSSLIGASLTWFSHFAVVTSFLSIGLGLAHFFADRFKLNPSAMGRAKSVGAAFVPPLIASLWAPYGFVTAIAYAGLFVAFSFFIVPAWVYRKLALVDSSMSPARWVFVLVFGVLVVALKVFSVFGWLPNYA